MDVGIIYCLAKGVLRGSALDRLADAEAVETAQAVGVALERYGHHVTIHNMCQDRPSVLSHYEVIFNLVENTAGSALTDYDMAEELEEMGLVFTGAGPAGLRQCCNKAWTKALLISQEIPTPRHQVVRSVGETVHGLQYPLIVKPVAEDGSAGIDYDSVVWDEIWLARKVAEILRVYQEPALVEEYIDGREINAALLGNGEVARVLPLSEMTFPPDGGRPRIVSFASNWVAGSYVFENTFSRCPIDLGARLEEKVKDIALRACRVTECRDYAWVDIRLRGETPYVIDVNPNPCINPVGSGYTTSAVVAGLTYDETINAILECALARGREAEGLLMPVDASRRVAVSRCA